MAIGKWAILLWMFPTQEFSLNSTRVMVGSWLFAYENFPRLVGFTESAPNEHSISVHWGPNMGSFGCKTTNSWPKLPLNQSITLLAFFLLWKWICKSSAKRLSFFHVIYCTSDNVKPFECNWMSHVSTLNMSKRTFSNSYNNWSKVQKKIHQTIS